MTGAHRRRNAQAGHRCSSVIGVQVARLNATDGASTISAVEVVEPVEEAK